MEQIKLKVSLFEEKFNTSNEDNVPMVSDREVSVGCYGVSYHNIDEFYHQMKCVQQYFGTNTNQEVIHLIVEYGDLVKDDKTACACSESCGEYFIKDYQVYYCTHQSIGSDKYHTHLLVNPVSYKDGKIFDVDVKKENFWNISIISWLCRKFNFKI